jgi:hypothetical protein
VAAHVHDAGRPQQRGDEDGQVAKHGTAVSPVEGERIEEHDEPEEPDHDTDDPPARERLAQEQPRPRRHPQRRRIGEHDGTAGGHQLQPERGEDHEADHVQERDAQQHGQVRAAWYHEGAESERQHEECRGAEGGADRRHPERRQDFEERLVHRPRDAPGERHRGQHHRAQPAVSVRRLLKNAQGPQKYPDPR